MPVPRPIVSEEEQKIPSPWWIAGFASGEANFLIGISKSQGSKSWFHCYLRFKLSQDCRDEYLLRSFITTFGCGSSVRYKELVEYLCVNTKELKIFSHQRMDFMFVGQGRSTFDSFLYIRVS